MGTLKKAILAALLAAVPGIAAAQPAEFQDCEDCPVMVEIAAGTIDRSDTVDGAHFTTTIGASYALSKTEVTIEQFTAYVEATEVSVTGCTIWTTLGPETPRRRSWKSPFPEAGVFPAHPVVCVSWDDAQAYIAWLSEKTGQSYRLPSEAEWSFAARSGAPNDANWWLTGNMSAGMANCADCTGVGPMGREDELSTLSSGKYVTNPFGLLDMLGNASEWVADCYNRSLENAPANGAAWDEGDCSRRVTLGGNWHDEWQALAGQRAGVAADLRVNDVGFRIARSLGE
ncbi:MAG: SUMF1/EgtB/PvdO family nonheme iron enzyme [Alphaproteobacteria bacterium]|nr:SUMF1/EgtB/PvdO family nonheme iron enzyme [Alphaproteobacteria bacterium]MBT5859590.1 SUMF1/EgtB/PvdO family nonheme iron enzyme [Alphaproteobacteria bacterium]